MKIPNLIENKLEFIKLAQSLKNKNKTINLGVTNLSFHRVTAALVTYILKEMGFEVNRTFALHEENFERLKNKKIDMISSAWIPSSHGVYKKNVEEAFPLIELGLHYEPYALWGVPSYVPKEEVSEISDLLKINVIDKMNNKIQGIGLGAGITRFSIKMMDEYSLKSAGYEFFTGTQDECIKAFEEAVKKKEWVIVPLWQPQYLHHTYKIRELSDPKGLLGIIDRAVLLCNKSHTESLFDENQIRILDKIILNNEIISELDYYHSVEGLSEDESIQKWIEKI
ncbi:glycine betaine ABC transporter substrate-binding protein [Poseidonibacter lekithochrous]|uniref:glycine betaine ABC transporter substrate-binding protein n=1 Tax=Poseidonibacter lekithochrous TaxID=1904463 RepID=UPI0009F89E64|nr:glycine betaine ABC transporter substrate-binding protein [Poseidonibacter lekithochrous]QKJ23644.1 glycine betaine ABC transporter, periplasmic component [Poseidonibacter lekithochrous]